MNYRHAYHAGNFADVVKHALMVRILLYLMRKDAPLRFIDTHAGIGRYDLSSEEAQRTGEWRGGIGLLAEASLSPASAELLKPYLDLALAEPMRYPGSPMIAQKLLRAQDRMSLCELHPHDERRLVKAVGRDPRMKVLAMDGYQGLRASVPPPERRGLVLIDPPYEQRDEFETLALELERAWTKWPTGTYAIWYPLKATPEVDAFRACLSQGKIRRVLCLELLIDDVQSEGPLKGTGLIVINPPFVFEAEARQLLPELARIMAQGRAQHRISWLAGE